MITIIISYKALAIISVVISLFSGVYILSAEREIFYRHNVLFGWIGMTLVWFYPILICGLIIEGKL